MAHYELYRKSTLGMALAESLEEMVRNQELSPELADQVLLSFDRAIARGLAETRSRANFKVCALVSRSLSDP